MRQTTPILMLGLVLAASIAAAPAMAENAPLRAGGPAAAPAKTPGATPSAGGGKVVETMDAGNYTYARVQTRSGEVWVAGPATPLKVGDAVEWPSGMEMKKFASKTLGRSFDSILFVDRLVAGGAASAAPSGSAPAAPHAGLSGKGDAPDKVEGIARADGGLTVAEVYDRRGELDGKEVLVRGKVVKFNAGVMNRNWIHLRDGSTASSGANDLTVTSDATAAVGNVVVVRGRVVQNKDFGFNYRYDVMLEGASVKVE